MASVKQKNEDIILKEIKYKSRGYILITKLISGEEYGGDDFESVSAYVLKDGDIVGDYIGENKFAYMLYKRGIKPQLIDSKRKVCSIGFCEKEQKWYGWSHRAIYGFGIGSEVKKGDCGYRANTVDEQIKKEIKFSDDIMDAHKTVICKRKTGFSVVSHYKNDLVSTTLFVKYEQGEGEWKANTLDDAKQMAINFAKSVS